MIFGSFSLAIAEMKTLLVALYQRYSTTVSYEFQFLSPTTTSRFELVYDDSFPIAEVCVTLGVISRACESIAHIQQSKECCVDFRKR